MIDHFRSWNMRALYKVNLLIFTYFADMGNSVAHKFDVIGLNLRSQTSGYINRKNHNHFTDIFSQVVHLKLGCK